ncbi:MAG: hypothetical protein AB7I30_06240 [Isosphaeraceae bacterium]
MRTILTAISPSRYQYTGRAHCSRCEGVLERHQPEASRPERMLGVCSECGTWFLIDEQLCLLYALPEIWSGPDVDN